MKATELRNKSITELKQELLELMREQFKLRMQKSNERLNRNHQFKAIRRDVARIKTVLNEKKGSAA
jgi:large subunit ribosomal protein L29